MITVHQVASYDFINDVSVYSRHKLSEEVIRRTPQVAIVPGTAEEVEAVDDYGRYLPPGK